MSEAPWLANYPAAIPHTIDVDAYASLVAIFKDSVRRHADKPAFSNEGTTLTYAHLDTESAAFAAWLSAQPGLEKGDRVAIMLPNLLQSPIAVLGVLRAGMVVVNVNPQYTPRELQHQLSDSGAKAIVVLDNFAHTLAEIVAETEVKTIVTTAVGDQHAAPKRWLINFVIRYVRKMVKPASLPGALRWRAVLADGAARTWNDLALTHDDVACLQYTGGTTGVAKGAVLSHGNLVANVLQIATWAGPVFDPENGVVVTPLPIYHVFALTVGLFGFMKLGGHNLLITDPRDFDRFIATLAKQPFVFLIGVNTLFNALLQKEAFLKLDFSQLRCTLAGGMAVQRDVAERWQSVTGCTIAQGYGLTEASPVVSANLLDTKQFNGSIGFPLPSTEVGILDDDGNELPIGEVGEICARGPQVMRGYWQRPGETEKVITAEGWLRTGDIGRLDAEGRLYIEDRKKDMIVVSGFKVFPNEVEDVVATHAGVLEVAAIGVPDEESGERVKLFVVKADPALTEDDVREYCREHLTGYKRPSEVEFRSELPKSNVGKVLRRKLKEET
jgi:long-chain acyl-CoA synthetase